MNHVFADPALFEMALTHTSWSYENGGEHNERLEFLGDAVLQVCATELLYQHFPDDREGTLHDYRSSLVSTTHLAGLARAWSLGEQVRLGKGEEATGGRDKDRLLAGVFEAVLGAVFLDAGMPVVRDLICAALSADLDDLPQQSDLRRVLHEWCQQQTGVPPVYDVTSTAGPAHERVFTVSVSSGGTVQGEGTGPSKRVASMAAAAIAVKKLGLEMT